MLYSMSPFFLSEWIVYSNCTNHLCFEKEKFENFHKYTKDAIVIGDNSTLEVQRIRSVIIHEKVLDGVLYIPKLMMNLLSVIQVTRKGTLLTLTLYHGALRKDFPLWLKDM